MARSHGERSQDAHNQGEQDYAERQGVNPPHGVCPTLPGPGSEKDRIEENAAYYAGYRNAKEQDPR